MTRFFTRLSFFLIVILMSVTIIVHARPYDDGELRLFLPPSESCLSPCFMGITPGVTTFKEALDRIDHHEWVQRINTRYLSAGREWFSFTWSGKQPNIIDDTGTPSVQGKQGIVQAIAVPVRVPIGDVFANWGIPVWSSGSISGIGIQYRVGFRDIPLQVGFRLPSVPKTITHLLSSRRVLIYYISEVPETIKPNPSLIDFITMKALTATG